MSSGFTSSKKQRTATVPGDAMSASTNPTAGKLKYFFSQARPVKNSFSKLITWNLLL